MITALDGTPISNLTFGTMQFGGRADLKDSQAMYDAARTAGITHFDTAHVYTDGASETMLGQFVRPEREKIIVATKAAYTGGAGRQNILETLETSRKRMDLDVIDILYLHRFDPDVDPRESFGALADLQMRGHIRYIGVSNYAAWQVVRAQWIAKSFDTRIDIIQPMYNLVKRQAEVEILPMAQDLGIEVAPYSPLGGGLLTGKYVRGESGRLTEDDRYAARYGLAWMHDAAEALSELAAAERVDPSTLAVAWTMAHDSRPKPIVSARSLSQLLPSLAASAYQMTADMYARISALSPAPPPATDRLEEM